MKLIMENWRKFLSEQKVELGPPDERKMMVAAINQWKPQIYDLAANNLDSFRYLHDRFPEVVIHPGSGRPGSGWVAWASFNPDIGSKGLITFYLDTWSGFIFRMEAKIKSLVQEYIENVDYEKKMTTEKATNKIPDAEMEHVRKVVTKFASMILSVTMAHELAHAIDYVAYGPADWNNPKFNRFFERRANELEIKQLQLLEPRIPELLLSLFDKLGYLLYEYGATDSDVSRAYRDVESFFYEELKIVQKSSHKWKKRYAKECGDDCSEESYKVKKGDSLYKIAKKFNLLPQELIKANGQIRDPNLIYPGQWINIPQYNLENS